MYEHTHMYIHIQACTEQSTNFVSHLRILQKHASTENMSNQGVPILTVSINRYIKGKLKYL